VEQDRVRVLHSRRLGLPANKIVVAQLTQCTPTAALEFPVLRNHTGTTPEKEIMCFIQSKQYEWLESILKRLDATVIKLSDRDLASFQYGRSLLKCKQGSRTPLNPQDPLVLDYFHLIFPLKANKGSYGISKLAETLRARFTCLSFNSHPREESTPRYTPVLPKNPGSTRAAEGSCGTSKLAGYQILVVHLQWSSLKPLGLTRPVAAPERWKCSDFESEGHASSVSGSSSDNGSSYSEEVLLQEPLLDEGAVESEAS